MVYPEIKIKEKRKSFSMRVKVSKKEVQGEVFTSEEVTELKRTILEEISYELDNLINLMVEDEELNEQQLDALAEALSKVSISVEDESEVEESEQEVEETEEQD